MVLNHLSFISSVFCALNRGGLLMLHSTLFVTVQISAYVSMTSWITRAVARMGLGLSIPPPLWRGCSQLETMNYEPLVNCVSVDIFVHSSSRINGWCRLIFVLLSRHLNREWTKICSPSSFKFKWLLCVTQHMKQSPSDGNNIWYSFVKKPLFAQPLVLDLDSLRL